MAEEQTTPQAQTPPQPQPHEPPPAQQSSQQAQQHPSPAPSAASPSGQNPIWKEVKVYRPPTTSTTSSSSSSSSSNLATTSSGSSAAVAVAARDDLKPTAAELKAAYADTFAGRHGPDAPLMTRAMREREDARLGRVRREYKEIRVRLRFSDRTCLEALFPSSSSLGSLYAFLRSSLDPAVLPKAGRGGTTAGGGTGAGAGGPGVVLYQTPPKRDFGEADAKLRGKTLGELLGNAPNATLLVRWSEAAMNANSYAAPLRRELLASAQELPAPPSFDAASPSHAAGRSGGPAGGSTSTSSGSVEEKVTKAMPKWLKGLQKK